MKVLLVDDEQEMVTTLAERLLLRDIEADWVLSGHEAIKRVKKKKCCLGDQKTIYDRS